MFLLGKFDPALHVISAASFFRRFRRGDLNNRATKNRYDCETYWLLLQHIDFSFLLLLRNLSLTGEKI
jgi:hypothetical protein